MSRYRWTPEAIARAVEVLGQHRDVATAVRAVSEAMGSPLTANALDIALRKAGHTSLHQCLGARRAKPIEIPITWDDETDDAPSPHERFALLVDVTKRATKKGEGLSFEALCDALRLSPSATKALLEDARAEGVSVDVAHERLFFRAPEATPSAPAVPVAPTSPGTEHRIAVFSDLHFGSKYCLREQFTAFVHLAYDTGVRDFFCPGDVIEGCYRHAQFERTSEGLDDQQTEFLDALPQLDGMRVFFIDGNHDYTFTDRTGIESGRNLVRLARERGRTDLTFLGSRGALVQYGDTKLELWHPKKGAAYALSYQMQNHIRDTAPHRRPHILLTGHTHQYVKVRQGGVVGWYAGTFQHGDGPYGRSIGGDTAMGGLLIGWRIDSDGRVRSLWDSFEDAYHPLQTYDVAV